MSAGSSSHVAACFSDDRTKYLMLSKSMPDRSAPQLGMGFLSNSRRPFSRKSSIHSGSLLSALDLADLRLGQTTRRGGTGSVGVGPAERVAAEPFEVW